MNGFDNKANAKYFMKLSVSAILIASFVTLSVYLILQSQALQIQRFKAQLAAKTDVEKIISANITELSINLLPYPAESTSTNTVLGTSIEHISKAQLAQFQNSGNVAYDLSKIHTTLTIDSVNIDGPVFSGEDAFTMDKGFWHFPLSKLPGERGNTVIIGHRFGKLPPATDTFFNLDLVKPGDQIVIAQDSGDLVYTVVETKVVEKTDRSILAPTTDYRLTLVTCHPLWTSDKRLVVVAKLDRVGVSL